MRVSLCVFLRSGDEWQTRFNTPPSAIWFTGHPSWPASVGVPHYSSDQSVAWWSIPIFYQSFNLWSSDGNVSITGSFLLLYQSPPNGSHSDPTRKMSNRTPSEYNGLRVMSYRHDSSDFCNAGGKVVVRSSGPPPKSSSVYNYTARYGCCLLYN